MSEKKSRKLSDIQAEYQGNCTKAGHLQYQIKTLSDDLAMVNGVLRELNLEASALPKEDPTPVAPPAEATPAPEATTNG